MAIRMTLQYTLAPLLFLIFNKFIYNHVGGVSFFILDYWGPTDYVSKIWLGLVQGQRFLFDDTPPFWAVSFCIFRRLGAY